VVFKRTSVELPIDVEDVRTIMFLLADIRSELMAIHGLLKDGDNGEESEEKS
jgi:hypothetical protein